MKNIIILSISLLIAISSFAQQGINYKAVLKDASGNLLSDTFMNVQFTIHQSTATGTIVYQEDHNYTTDANGLLILNIGTDPSPSVGVFADIDWGADLHFLQTSITYSGGTINFDATEFMAVPYAKHAKSATLKTVNNVTSNSPGDISADSFVFGSSQMDDDPAITEDNFRMFFNKTKGAFRSGIASNNEWDDVNIGIGSTALGNGTIASGDNATAFGLGSKALGNNSTALGKNTFASTENSLAIGWLNVDEPDALFMVGNGFFDGINADFSNALVVYNDGQVIAPSFDLAEITDDKALVTKEYVDTSIPEAPSGLEQITEETAPGSGIFNTGWRLKGFDPANYGPIGDGAVDLSYSDFSSTSVGATRIRSTAMGYRTIASGYNSTAMGSETVASGYYSTSMGWNTTAPGSYSLTIGRYNEDYIQDDQSYVQGNDPIFVIGNGYRDASNNIFKSNALTVLRDGNSIFYGEIQSPSTGNANMIPIAYGSFDGDDGTDPFDILSGTENFTVTRAGDFTYTISVNGQSLSVNNTSASVVVSTDFFRTANVTYSGGDMKVHIFSSTFNKVPAPFQFIIYKN